MSIRVNLQGLDDMIKAMGDISTEGVRRAQAELDDALSATMEVSRGLAHVSHDARHSGQLKASADRSSEHGSEHWEGTITFADRGAIFELQRGGDHSAFIDSLAHLSVPDFERALDSMFRDL